MAYLPITDHGLIGDLHTAALIDNNGRLVWLPWPRFDAASLFTALLDDTRGGHWLLAPQRVLSSRQRYEGETAILVTEFETATGRVELIDWMSPWEGAAPGHDLCRILRCIEGEVQIQGHFAPRPDYAQGELVISKQAKGLQFEAHGFQVQLDSSHQWQIGASEANLRTTLRQGEEIHCILKSGIATELEAILEDLRRTRQFWQSWIEKCTYDGLWCDAVHRSAITLKLLTYAPTGAIIAAPTTSLPEWPGGVRNWDYRYTWLRDASLTLYALYHLGYRDEAEAFFQWLDTVARRYTTPLQIMYSIDGEEAPDEVELTHLEGYCGSQPVRIGNGARHQRQLDVYGGVLDAAYLHELHGDFLQFDQWKALCDEIDYVCHHWNEPDSGIWEIRGPMQHHTFSKLMCWLTLDRGLRISQDRGWNHNQEAWRKARDAIRDSLFRYGWNQEVGAFTQYYGSSATDASVLLLPLVGLLPPEDPRVHATIERIDNELADGALVYRYRSDDHLPGNEGAFLLCSFWMVDALSTIGKVEQAVERFEQLLRYASPHGLLAEEVDPATGSALGNYPQAFSHIGLINSALNLTHKLQRSPEPPAPGTAESASGRRTAS